MITVEIKERTKVYQFTTDELCEIFGLDKTDAVSFRCTSIDNAQLQIVVNHQSYTETGGKLIDAPSRDHVSGPILLREPTGPAAADPVSKVPQWQQTYEKICNYIRSRR